MKMKTTRKFQILFTLFLGFVTLSIPNKIYGGDRLVYVYSAPEVELVVEKEISPKEKECLAQNIYFEARSESYQGKLAVATVTLNRVETGKYPKTICGVVWQKKGRHCQFSWTCDGKSDRIANTVQYAMATQVADEVLHKDKRSDIIGADVVYFHSTSIKPPRWTRRLPKAGSVGKHIFYRRA